MTVVKTITFDVALGSCIPLIHALVIPIMLAFFANYFAVLYWLIPTAAYLTVAVETLVN